MMATVPHVTFGLGLRKFQADGFLLTRVYVSFSETRIRYPHHVTCRRWKMEDGGSQICFMCQT